MPMGGCPIGITPKKKKKERKKRGYLFIGFTTKIALLSNHLITLSFNYKWTKFGLK
jgi:hypothetical protein